MLTSQLYVKQIHKIKRFYLILRKLYYCSSGNLHLRLFCITKYSMCHFSQVALTTKNIYSECFATAYVVNYVMKASRSGGLTQLAGQALK